MKIGIIGIGNIGGTLARKLSASGHEVSVANSKGADAVKAFADEIGATATDAAGAVQGAEAVIVAIPFHKAADLPEGLFTGLDERVPVVDTSNYYPGMLSPQIAEIDAGLVESVWVSQQLGRPVIKAFNNILAASLAELGKPKGAEGRLAVAVAGDNQAQKQLVMRLVEEVGFDPVDGGTLDQSWRQQPCTPVYCCDFDAAQSAQALLKAQPGEARQKLAKLPQMFASLGPSPSHEEVVAANRRLNAA